MQVKSVKKSHVIEFLTFSHMGVLETILQLLDCQISFLIQCKDK
jgi:hypothetical protein